LLTAGFYYKLLFLLCESHRLKNLKFVKAIMSGSGNEILYGAHPIIEMLKAKKRKLISIYTTKPLPKAWERIQRYLPKSVPNIQYVTKDVLDRMAGCSDHMGVVAWVGAFKFTAQMFDPAKKPFVLLLDSIQDVRNAGAILRSAYCTGVDGVVMCKTKAAPMTPAVFKASAGLAEHLDIHIASSLKQAVQDMKKAGYNFYMAVLDGKDTTTVDFKKPACLVIGNEATGIAKDIKAMGELITLPQRTPDISYNASVAAGILLFLISMKIKNK
jgi:23S rRNA (guanosine2251-2'-O)-methyltransferase